MHAVSSLLLLGAYAIQPIFSRPDASRVRRDSDLLKRSVDSFIATESLIALNHILCNIGSSGCDAAGASSGVVVASPSQVNPDCKSSLLLVDHSTLPPDRLLHLDEGQRFDLQVPRRHLRALL